MITQINHIGIAVKSLDDQIPFYRDILKLQFIGTEEVADQKVRVAMFRVGEVNIELLAPAAADSPVAKFIETRGEGLHHIAFESDHIEEQIADLNQHNIQMIDNKPRSGAHGSKIAFIHPKSSGRVLTEICQK